MSTQDALFVDYQRTAEAHKTLVDVRFRLLALVPALAAAGFALLRGEATDKVVGVAAIGLVATIAVTIYEIRNTQLHDAAVHRLKHLEGLLAFPPSVPDTTLGGVMRERPRGYRIGVLGLYHDFALALAYSASVGAWYWLLSTSLWESATGALRPLLTEYATALVVAVVFVVFFAATKPRGLAGSVFVLPEPPEPFDAFLDALTKAVRAEPRVVFKNQKDLLHSVCDVSEALGLTRKAGKLRAGPELAAKLDVDPSEDANVGRAELAKALDELLRRDVVGYREVELAMSDVRGQGVPSEATERIVEVIAWQLARDDFPPFLRREGTIRNRIAWLRALDDHSIDGCRVLDAEERVTSPDDCDPTGLERQDRPRDDAD